MIHSMKCTCTSCKTKQRHRTDNMLRAIYILGGLAIFAMLLFS